MIKQFLKLPDMRGLVYSAPSPISRPLEQIPIFGISIIHRRSQVVEHTDMTNVAIRDVTLVCLFWIRSVITARIWQFVTMESQKPETSKMRNAYHKEKMLLCKQEEAGVQLNAEQADWKDDTDDEYDDQECKSHLSVTSIDPRELKCEINDSKNQNKFLESSNKALVDKLKGEIEDFKTKNKSLESSNNHFKEANNELSKTNQLMFKDLKKFQAEQDKL
ncbi:hypothetical protein Tco_0590807 [Tanacetum coccineum]